jgi:serine/threonine-protein kinase HipA
MGDILNIKLFGEEIGRLGYDNDKRCSYFQYSPDYLTTNNSKSLPFIIKRNPEIQSFPQFEGKAFRGLPPMFADSLPDVFGNHLFQSWLNTQGKPIQLNALEQLAYVGRRGMGAWEYEPTLTMDAPSSFRIAEMAQLLKEILADKESLMPEIANAEGLLNLFRIGTSAGGMRPKILVARHRKTNQIMPGDLLYGPHHDYFLVKLNLENDPSHPKETIEFIYASIAQQHGIDMMPCELWEGQHFATHRFDRQNNQKQHVLTASGLTGWDYQNTEDSSYENLFKLAMALKIPLSELQQLFRRMVFNVVFNNIDDHLKNHSFTYHPKTDQWHLSPAYDLTYALNPKLKFHKVSRALSICGKREQIARKDLLKIADTFSIEQAEQIIREIQEGRSLWSDMAYQHHLSPTLINTIQQQMVEL